MKKEPAVERDPYKGKDRQAHDGFCGRSTGEMCRVIIHGASIAAAAAGGGLAPLPCSDADVITPIQIGMITALGQVFGMELTQTGAAAVLACAAGRYAGRTISGILADWLPGLDGFLNAGTAACVTAAIGWTVIEVFSGWPAEQTEEEKAYLC